MPTITQLPVVDMDLAELIEALESNHVLVWRDPPPGQTVIPVTLTNRLRLSDETMRKLRAVADASKPPVDFSGITRGFG